MADGEQRTYSIWPIVGVMVVLASVGLYLVLTLGGTSTTPTVSLPADVSSTTEPATSAPTTTSLPAPTFPNGASAPDRIREVVTEPGEVRYLYEVPAELRTQATAAVVAPVSVAMDPTGTQIEVTMTCAPAAGSVPAAVVVTEDPVEVRVTGVAVGPQLGEPCPPLEVIETITLPLEQPLGARRLTAEPAGARVDLGSLG